MNIEEYLGQGEYYFSESAGQLIPLHEMPFPQAFNSHMKLVRENYSDYRGTVLCKAFERRLSPSPVEIRNELTRYGKSCHLYVGSTTQVRSKMYSSAKRAGKNVKTHKVVSKASSNLGWIEAVVTVDAVVRVKGKVVS